MGQEVNRSFRNRWIVFNTLSLLITYILYTPIAHGLTGPHPQGLDAFQILMHSIALAVIAATVSFVQRRELARYVSIPWMRIPLAVIGFVAAFWAGFYQPWLGGPDLDILFGSFVLGSAVFLGSVPTNEHRLAMVVAMLAFPVGCFIGQVIVLAVVVSTGIVPDLQTNTLHHSLYWIIVGVSMGTLGGWIGGQALSRMLPSSNRTR